MANERNITWSVLLLQALEGVGWTTACFCVTTHLMYYNAFHYQIQNLPEGSEKTYNKLKQQLTNFCVVCLGVLFNFFSSVSDICPVQCTASFHCETNGCKNK